MENAAHILWESLPDGPVEHITAHLSRQTVLACRLVCRAWRSSFVHALTPLTVDTRFFSGSQAASAGHLPGQSGGHPCPFGAQWESFVGSIAPTLHAVTVRISLHHDSKARAAPCTDSCVACLQYLASFQRYNQERLQLVLPLRFALPDAVASVLATALVRLRSLRLVRCSLTQQLATALGRLPNLRHLCVAHATLAALPQLLEAGTQLEHLHVQGYHSLVIVEDNAHLQACWRSAVALVRRTGTAEPSYDGPQQQALSAGAPQPSHAGEGTAAIGRLRCLAVSAHQQYHDAVLDETELGFESEALCWQIRYDRSTDEQPRFWSGPAGSLHHEPVPREPDSADALERDNCGCWPDPREDPGGAPACGSDSDSGRRGMHGCGRGRYMGGGSGGSSLCAATLVGIRCGCCCWPPESRGPDGCGHHGVSREGRRRAAAGAATILAPQGPAAEPPNDAAVALAAPDTALGAKPGGDPADPQPAAGAAGPAGAAGAAGPQAGTPNAPASPPGPARPLAVPPGLHLLRSGKRELSLAPQASLHDELIKPHWRHLQYVQMALIPGPEPPPLPPLAVALPQGPNAEPPGSTGSQPPLRLGEPSGGGTSRGGGSGAAGGAPSGSRTSRSLSGSRGIDDGGGGGDGGGEAMSTGNGAGDDRDSDGRGVGRGSLLGGVGHEPGAPTLAPLLAPLNALRELTGLWLDPDEWDGEEEAREGAPLGRQDECASGAMLGPNGDAAGTPKDPLSGLTPELMAGQRRPSVSVSAIEPQGRQPALRRWGRVGDVWVPLHDLSAAIPDASGHAPVLDALPYAVMLCGCTRLRSLALGDRRAPFLGVGDDTAALLAQLSGLTRLHLSASYTLPLASKQEAGAAAAAPYPHIVSGTEATLPQPGGDEGFAAGLAAALGGRLAPLGALTALQRLSLHFSNPFNRPAVVSQAALPPSLTSLALHGVILVPAGGCRTNAPADTAAAAVGKRMLSVGIREDTHSSVSAGGLLSRLRELSLMMSYIVQADLLGCGGHLVMLSLTDSVLGLGDDDGGEGFLRRLGAGGRSSAAGDDDLQPGRRPHDDASRESSARRWQQEDGGLAGLLRRWYGVQTLRVVGSPPLWLHLKVLAYGGSPLDWFSPAALLSIVRCLPALQILNLASPATAAFPAASVASAQPVAPSSAAGTSGHPTSCPHAGTPHGLEAAAAGPSTSHPVQPAAAGTMALTHGSSVPLPNWRLTISAEGLPKGRYSPGAAQGDTLEATAEPSRAATRASERPGNEGAATTQLGRAASTGPQQSHSLPGPDTRDGSTVYDRPVGPWTPGPDDWLTALLGLLSRYTPHLTSLSIACVAADRQGGEAAVRAAAAWLPARLRHLTHLSLVLDLALEHVVAQPQPERYARAWAEWLKGEEEELQAHMRFTCVALTGDPRAANRARDAARALPARLRNR